MNADCYFEIGSTHWICEDYALAGSNGDLCYAIVCDGCSSSTNTDVGARIMAHIAKDTLIYMHAQDLLRASYRGYLEVFQQLVVKKALEVSSTLSVRLDTLDATLLVAAAVGEHERFLMGWGDGFFIIKLANGITRVLRMEYESNAPYYLTYEMNPLRKEIYRKDNSQNSYGPMDLSIDDVYLKYDNTGNPDLVIFKDVSEDHLPSMYASIGRILHDEENAFPEEGREKTDMANINSIIVSSDGLNTYENNPKSDNRRAYGWLDILPHVMEFRNPVGEFVKRRMRKVKKTFEKEGIVHIDDISVAAINLQ